MLNNPWVLGLLVIVPWLGWQMWSNRDRGSIRYSSAAMGWQPSRTWRLRLLWVPPVLTLTAIALIIVALARPRFGRDQTVIRSEGIAIQLVIDRSGSMRALDFKIDNRHVDRLTAIKSVAKDFVEGDVEPTSSDPFSASDELPGRSSDLVGLITFAGYVDSLVPLTLDHEFLLDQMDRTQIVNNRNEDGTAIGDAITLAVDKLSQLEEESEIESRVIILLTDGENTAGEIEPVQAAELAKAMGVKIYTIGVGTKGQAPFPVRIARDGTVIVRPVEVNIDEDTLTKIAEVTGGDYFRATNTESLEKIYAEIDQMEKTEVATERWTDYREWAVQWTMVAGHRMPPLLLIAFALLVCRLILESTVLRQLA